MKLREKGDTSGFSFVEAKGDLGPGVKQGSPGVSGRAFNNETEGTGVIGFSIPLGISCTLCKLAGLAVKQGKGVSMKELGEVA